MKRILALLMAMAMVFAFTACSDDSGSGSGDAAKVAAYIEENQDQIAEGFAGSGADEYADCKVKASGTEVVIECKFKIEIPEEAASQLQDTLDSMESTFEAGLEEMQNEEPAITGMTIKYLNQNGKLLAKMSV